MFRNYKVVDVFTSTPLLGNPVAVVLDAEGLTTAQMQAIAGWTNLSETTFLLPPTSPEADYAVRIFTPVDELPFAGHPTLGSAHAALEAGRASARGGVLVQECAVGLVRLSVGDRSLAFELPPAEMASLPEADVATLEAVLGAPILAGSTPAMVNVGPVWLVAELADAAAVVGLEPDYGAMAQFERRIGATGITVSGAGADGVEVRSFAPSSGVNEDPVCGSGNGSVAVYRFRRGLLPAQGGAYVAAQGQRVGRAGRVDVTVGPEGAVTIGGACVTVVEGRLAV
ncbi:PhzF family phenazine biosynthesis protein [Phenylobacterium immobile]|uniref:PhzF family phenazine biosynthesis protein n=1 Tax=Phenylobacterium immobile TaxID=21 RepID=UPI000B040EC4|nr:PhzF family phenazine biosynthesis protein [Phenylobacterium immobile]